MPRLSTIALSALFTACSLTACAAEVSDLDDLTTDLDACDPRGDFVLGTDLDLTFVGVEPHVNEDMLFAVTVGERRDVEAMMVLSTLSDQNLELTVPKLLPGEPSELAFWADTEPPGFNPIGDEDVLPDHQWRRPVCPNGALTFSHTTPFQDVQGAIATGSIFEFQIPEGLRHPELFDNYVMWVRATKLADDDLDKELQTRAYFRWSPLVEPPDGSDVPPQRAPPSSFRVGGALGERGAIDGGSSYNIEFVIDLDSSGTASGDDFVCRFERERAPSDAVWAFVPNVEAGCDPPDGFESLIPGT